MVVIYVRRIRNNEMTIEEVPQYWKSKVQLEITN
ncbi:CD1375 family protein [Clostridium algidicarnis]